jgi:uncharacterized protein (DUF1697 family)
MNDLIGLFREGGCHDVRTYIQSGNVIFSADSTIAAALPSIIAEQIAERFGYRVPVVVRTAEQIGEVIRNNPLVEEGTAADTLHVLFLAEQPSARSVESLDPDRSPPDMFIVRGREVYLRLPHGVARTRLTNDYFDAKLGTMSTGRNWRTVTTLFELMER